MNLRFLGLASVILLAMPSVCPAMVMEPSVRGEMVTRHASVAEMSEHGAHAAFSDAAVASVPECCVRATGHNMAHMQDQVSPTASVDLLAAPTSVAHISAASRLAYRIFYTPQDTGPPPTFEERSVMRRE
jgi:hypothetical protein